MLIFIQFGEQYFWSTTVDDRNPASHWITSMYQNPRNYGSIVYRGHAAFIDLYHQPYHIFIRLVSLDEVAGRKTPVIAHTPLRGGSS